MRTSIADFLSGSMRMSRTSPPTRSKLIKKPLHVRQTGADPTSMDTEGMGGMGGGGGMDMASMMGGGGGGMPGMGGMGGMGGMDLASMMGGMGGGAGGAGGMDFVSPIPFCSPTCPISTSA